jgi:serine/threonine protein phosphatase PrpC
MSNSLKVSLSQYSQAGRKPINQDFYDARVPNEPQRTMKGIAIALADGISSSQVSDVASRISVSSFLNDYFSTPQTWTVNKSIKRILTATNSWLNSQSREALLHLDKNKAYVCTFSTLILRSTTAYLAHLGDTRIYLLRDGELSCLTDDHRLWISEEKSYLSRAMGMDNQINPDFHKLSLNKDDIFLLATDGVYEFLKDDELIQILCLHDNDFENAAQAVVEKAYANGSDDNLTAQLVRVDDLPDKNPKEVQSQINEKPFPPQLQARDDFDGYTIVRELSATSRSHVYLALDNETSAQVVIKIPSIELQENKHDLERFAMEEWIARRITSQHLMKAYEQTQTRNYLYNVFEYVKGQTLEQIMTDTPCLEIERVRDITDQMVRGILAFHRLDMVHQDIRPHNILIDDTQTVKIIDFGATKIEGIQDINTFLAQDHLQGTALYSAPEYFLGHEGDHRSDIFSLGVIVYQMLSNKLPYELNVARATTTKAQKKLHYHSLHNDPIKLPMWIDEALRKALEIEPHKRYNDVAEFAYDLRHPNPIFLAKQRPPLIERDPVSFWKNTSFILAILLVVALIN